MKIKSLFFLMLSISFNAYMAEAALEAPKNRTAIILINPHAGWRYSYFDPIFLEDFIRALGEASNPIQGIRTDFNCIKGTFQASLNLMRKLFFAYQSSSLEICNET